MRAVCASNRPKPLSPVRCRFRAVGRRRKEPDRKRGAQQALIAPRLARAEQIGCTIQLSETHNILEHSLRNLQRAGFREIYEKEVYAWGD